MEWLQTIVTCIGLIIIWYFQRKKIDALEKSVKTQKTSIDTQSQLLKDVDVYIKLFNPQLLKEGMEFYKDGLDIKTEAEIEKIQKEYDDQIKDQEKSAKELAAELTSVRNIAFNSFFLLPGQMRKTILLDIEDPRQLSFFKKLDVMIQKRVQRHHDEIEKKQQNDIPQGLLGIRGLIPPKKDES